MSENNKHRLTVNTYRVDQIANPIDKHIARLIWIETCLSLEPDFRFLDMDVHEEEKTISIVVDLPKTAIINPDRLMPIYLVGGFSIQSILFHNHNDDLRMEIKIQRPSSDAEITEQIVQVNLIRRVVVRERGFKLVVDRQGMLENGTEPTKKDKREQYE